MKNLRTIMQISLFVALPVATVVAYNAGASAAKNEPAPRYFEMRTYTTHPGRMDALKKRFREHTGKYFKKHGMDQLGYWQVVSGENAENTLVYILAYPTKEARDASWKAFGADQDWKKAFTDSEKDGKIVAKAESRFMTAADFSAIK